MYDGAQGQAQEEWTVTQDRERSLQMEISSMIDN